MAGKQLSPELEGQVQNIFNHLLQEYVLKLARARFDAFLVANKASIDAEVDAVISPIMSDKITKVTVDAVEAVVI